MIHIQEAQLQVEGQLLEQVEGEGHAVRVTVLKGGTSKNGYSYNEQALQEIARLLEGAQAYADHARSPSDQVNRSVRDVVGFYHNVEYVAGTNAQPGRVDATLHIFEAADWLWSMVKEACELGRPELIGLSIDIFGHWQHNATTKTKDVTSIMQLNSCDVVTKPSAGGAFQRVLHHLEIGDPSSMTQTSETPIQEPAVSSPTEPLPTLPPQQVQESASPIASLIQEQQQELEVQRKEVENLLAEARLQRAELTLERRLQESILPEAVKQQVRNRFTGRVFEESDLEHELSTSLQLMAQLSKDGMVKGHGYEKASVEGMISEAEKVQAAFDRMFDLGIDNSRLGNIRAFASIREAYARVTGESSLQAGIAGNSNLGTIRISENAPIPRINEADTTTATFSYLLGTSMNKRMLADYQAWPAEWMKFVNVVPVLDFKQQSRVRMGAFGSLPIVAENSAYNAVTLSDSAATYIPQKRGNLVTVSRETIINDDLHAIKQIPSKLAVAAAYTLAEFVYSFLSSNPIIYDGSNLFTTAAPHTNLGASALSTNSMQTGVTAMRQQANFAGKRIGLRPRYLVVPPELEWQSMIITKSAGVPGSANNDINPMQGYVTPIVSAQLTNTTQWFLVGDPREVDTIEIGFIGGQTNPSLFIQDQPLVGLNFSQDAISYKIRHEYGGAVVDYRGLYRGI